MLPFQTIRLIVFCGNSHSVELSISHLPWLAAGGVCGVATSQTILEHSVETLFEFPMYLQLRLLTFIKLFLLNVLGGGAACPDDLEQSQ